MATRGACDSGCWAVACVICDAVGYASRQRPADIERANPGPGWRWIAFRSQGAGWLCHRCADLYQSMRPPKTRGECVSGPRPCPHALCRYHLEAERSRKAPRDFEIEETCALDVAEKEYEFADDRDLDGGHISLTRLGAVLGCGREGIRYRLGAAFRSLRARGVTPHAFRFEEHAGQTDYADANIGSGAVSRGVDRYREKVGLERPQFCPPTRRRKKEGAEAR